MVTPPLLEGAPYVFTLRLHAESVQEKNEEILNSESEEVPYQLGDLFEIELLGHP